MMSIWISIRRMGSDTAIWIKTPDRYFDDDWVEHDLRRTSCQTKILYFYLIRQHSTLQTPNAVYQRMADSKK